MKQNIDTTRHPRRRLATLLAFAAVSIAVLVVAISATGGYSSSYRAASARPTPAAQVAPANRPTRAAKVPKHAVHTAPTHTPAAQPKAAPPPAAQPSPAIPQQNGGDSDPDNSGGPNDRDGNI